MGHREDEAASQLDLQSVLALRARQEQHVGEHQRRIERLTLALGRPRAIYVTLGLALTWVAFNLLAPAARLPVLDAPPFSLMQGLISLGALLMTVMVLTTQNRQAKHAEQRAQLDLQVNLLAEQKIAKLIALVEELRHDMPEVRDRQDAVAEAMTNAMDPEAVISVLEEGLEVSHTMGHVDPGTEPKKKKTS